MRGAWPGRACTGHPSPLGRLLPRGRAARLARQPRAEATMWRRQVGRSGRARRLWGTGPLGARRGCRSASAVGPAGPTGRETCSPETLWLRTCLHRLREPGLSEGREQAVVGQAPRLRVLVGQALVEEVEVVPFGGGWTAVGPARSPCPGQT